MDTFQTAVKLIRPGCFMASVHLTDAYYSIPIAIEDRKYLMFEWQSSYYQFACLPNGLACAPRMFTKILKPVYTHLRMLGNTCMGHIDDSLLVAQHYKDCEANSPYLYQTWFCGTPREIYFEAYSRNRVSWIYN